MPPIQNAGSSGMVRSSAVIRKYERERSGLAGDGPLACTTAFGVGGAPRGVDDERVVGRRHLLLDRRQQRVVGRPARRRASSSSSTGPRPRQPVGVVEPDRPESGARGELQRTGAVGSRSSGSAAASRSGEVAPQEASGRRRGSARRSRRTMWASSGGVASVLIGRDQRPDAQRGVERRQPQDAVGRQQRRCGSPCRRRLARSACGHLGRAPIELARRSASRRR